MTFAACRPLDATRSSTWPWDHFLSSICLVFRCISCIPLHNISCIAPLLCYHSFVVLTPTSVFYFPEHFVPATACTSLALLLASLLSALLHALALPFVYSRALRMAPPSPGLLALASDSNALHFHFSACMHHLAFPQRSTA